MFDLKLINFRGFKEQNFSFSKINILIGENSSGKSSVLKFLLALKQTIYPPNNRETNFAFTGELSDLGSFKESIYYHNSKLKLSFSFSFGKPYSDYFIKFLIPADSNEDNLPDNILTLIEEAAESKTTIDFTIDKDLALHKKIITKITNHKIGSLHIEHNNPNNSLEQKLLFGHNCELRFADASANQEIFLNDIQFEKDGFFSIIDGVSLQNKLESYLKPNKEKDIIPEDKAIHPTFLKIAFLLIVQNYVRYQLEKIEYINPVNTSPSRAYLSKENKQNININNLEDIIQFFGKRNDESKSLMSEFVNLVNETGIAENFEIIQDGRLPVSEIRIKIKDLKSNIKDVGYGVSLLLPIILKSLIAERTKAKENSLLLIEQPEVHLHPMLHANIIDTIVKLSHKTSYLIETHSEHIIRKLQVLVKEKNMA